MNTCIVCLESNNLIEYDHCGLYYVHEECLDKWEKDECIICRQKIIKEDSRSKCKLRTALAMVCSGIAGMFCIFASVI